jgi:lysophospholipase L1-like esterase
MPPPEVQAGSGGQPDESGLDTGGAPAQGSGGATTSGDNSGGALSEITGGSHNGAGGSLLIGSGGQPAAGVGGSGDWPEASCPAPRDLGVRIIGRHDGCDEQGVRMAWSGTGFVARLSGTGLSFTQSGGAVQYTVLVDGEARPDLITHQGTATDTVDSGLTVGEHLVEVYRRGEASFGATTLMSVEALGGTLLAPPAHPGRGIEFYGDSITCGYGNEGTTSGCSFSADTENHYLTYAALLGRKFMADTSTIAWSGKGVVVNYNGDLSTTLPQMAERALPDLADSVWDFSLLPPPQAVIVNLSTNDFSTDHDPSAEEFKGGYLTLLRRIRAWYPGAFILGTVGPMLSGADLDKARSGIQAAIDEMAAAGDQNVLSFELQVSNTDPGCDYHPNLTTHQAMADELAPILAQRLGW